MICVEVLSCRQFNSDGFEMKMHVVLLTTSENPAFHFMRSFRLPFLIRALIFVVTRH